MSENSSEIVKAQNVKTPRPLLKKPFAFVLALLLIPLVAIALFAEVFKYTSAFSYSATGDLTPTNTSSLQVFAVRSGISKLNDVQRPSKGCTDSFTVLTCNLWIASAVLNLLGGLAAIATAALFIWLAKAKKPKESKVWGSYFITSALSFLAFAIGLGLTLTAAFRVLRNELNPSISKSVSDGIRPVVQSTVAAGIVNSTNNLQQASLLLHWAPLSFQISNSSSPLFNETISKTCNYSTTVITTDTATLISTTKQYLGCLTVTTSPQQVQQYNTTAYALFHNASLVAAFNAASKLTLPLSTPPSTLDDLISTKAYAVSF